MTSEGPHRPGQEPDEVSPGAGGPAPYGDRPAQPDNGSNAAGPDLGWAPPPPPARPNPSWATQVEQQPNPAWGAAAAPQPSDPAQPAWAAGGPPEPAPTAQWTPAQQAWTPPEQPAPAWPAASAEQQPDWAQTQPAARGAAQVPPATAAWPAQDDPSRSGGWAGGAAPVSPSAPQWHAEPAQHAGRAGVPAQQDDPSGSGGWPVGAAAAREDQPVWTPAEQLPQTWGQPAGQAEEASPGWAPAEAAGARGAAQVPAGTWPAQDDAPQPTAWGAAESRPQQPDWVLPSQDQPVEHPEPTAWPQAEQAGPASARASVSVPGNDATPGWAAAGPDNQAPAAPGVAQAEPWSAGEVWGRAEAEASAQARGGWDADRGDEPPVYQPAPAPGISPANAVPLPPQEQRVPGASLAAAPPADYVPPTPFAALPEQPAYPERDTPDVQHDAEPVGWGRGEEASPGAALVPAPRTSPESGAGRAVVPAADAEPAAGAAGRASASASVPLASRVMPPADQAMRPASAAAPQPRVYGRPSRPEEDEPQQAGPEAFQANPSPEHPGTPDWQQDADRPSAPDWPQAPERPAVPDWQQDAGRPSVPDWPQAPERQSPPDWQNGPERQGFPGWGEEAPSAPNGFGEPPAAAAAAPPAFPPGVPSFVDTPGNNRPMNGVRPQSGGERPDDRFGPGAPAAGTATVNGAAGFGPAVEQPPGAQFPAFPPPQPTPSWGQEASQSDQGRFDSFKPDADEPKVEPPTPKVRNGRVLAAVLIAAVLILAVPLGLLMLLGKFGGGNDTPAFDPAVGTCVKQVGQGASEVNCAEAGAFTIVSKVDAKDKCADPAQPHVVLPGEGTNRVLCLKPATK
ncbi:hypothetical protein [Micromonospora sp. NPDC049107]|uniref:hypothetical protein n=1 Tax=unclassified Micromonospora TaxID=2617518 RepID=UPI0033C95AC5